jgi:hypothetical protein
MINPLGQNAFFSIDKVGDNPHTSWIKPSNKSQQDWLKNQVSKKICNRITVQNLNDYIQGRNDFIADFELTKSRMKNIETNWRAHKSKKGKSTLTISGQANRRFRKLCEEGELSTIELFDRIAEQYTQPMPDQITAPRTIASTRSSSDAFVALSRIPALIRQLEELTRLYEEKSQAAWGAYQALDKIEALDSLEDGLNQTCRVGSRKEVDEFRSLVSQIAEGLNALNESSGL